ncbi:MAG TPA: DUF349 domain-containing protein [Aeromicrobium sp.]|nr:DUF349 domain-containing protein [Aeromicrobium sp.]
MSDWGRVDADGNVYVKEGDAERLIGQWVAGGDAEEALAFYVRRFDNLQTEVDLLEKRLESGKLSAEDAEKAISTVREQLVDAHAVGDLASLSTRLDALEPKLEEARAKRKAEREKRNAESAEAKNRIVAEAEKIAAGRDWRAGADRLRVLLDEWKELPRLSKGADDELWHRFSSARTAFTKKRKAHFGEQNVAREQAQKIKEKLIVEAESLSGSTDWGDTSAAYRDLMQQWKAAGSAPRNVEDKLWKRFRAAQDAFFSAREAENAAQDEEFAQNAEVKRALLVEAEALLPITNLDAARKALNSLAERWEAAGKVPRDQMKDLEGRLRAVERAVREAGEQEWKRTDPEKTARADDMISKLESAIAEIQADLEAAEAAGDKSKAKKLRENLQSRQAFLEMALKTASDFNR